MQRTMGTTGRCRRGPRTFQSTTVTTNATMARYMRGGRLAAYGKLAMVQTRAKIQTALDDGAGALRAAAKAHHRLQRRRQRSLSGGNLSEKAARMAGRVVDGALFWTIPDELSKRFRPFDEARATTRARDVRGARLSHRARLLPSSPHHASATPRAARRPRMMRASAAIARRPSSSTASPCLSRSAGRGPNAPTRSRVARRVSLGSETGRGNSPETHRDDEYPATFPATAALASSTRQPDILTLTLRSKTQKRRAMARTPIPLGRRADGSVALSTGEARLSLRPAAARTHGSALTYSRSLA